MSIDYLEANKERFDAFEPVDGDSLYWVGPPVGDIKKWELVHPDKQQLVQFSSLSRLQAALASHEPQWTLNAVHCVSSNRISRNLHARLAGRAIRRCP